MNKRYINKKFRSERLRDTVASVIPSYTINNGGGSGSGISFKLSDIRDVDTSAKQEGFVLTYNKETDTYIFKNPDKDVFWDKIKEKPDSFNPIKHTHTTDEIIGDIDCGTY